ncbi:hypothetical protein DIPPA_61420 [Diplonema papillatum]|nr:hypothetical protein DIPPA_61420 [Diplonema papillatum]
MNHPEVMRNRAQSAQRFQFRRPADFSSYIAARPPLIPGQACAAALRPQSQTIPPAPAVHGAQDHPVLSTQSVSHPFIQIPKYR